MNFDIAFDRLIGHEGGLSMRADDPGNWTGGKVGAGQLRGTKFGIAAKSYPDLDIEHLTIEQAKAIYRRDFWGRLGPDVDPSIAYQYWDFAINSGHGTATRKLQQAVGVADDGNMGDITRAAIRLLPPAVVCMRYLGLRLAFMASLSIWPTYGRGWANRIAGNLAFAAGDVA